MFSLVIPKCLHILLIEKNHFNFFFGNESFFPTRSILKNFNLMCQSLSQNRFTTFPSLLFLQKTTKSKSATARLIIKMFVVERIVGFEATTVDKQEILKYVKHKTLQLAHPSQLDYFPAVQLQI